MARGAAALASYRLSTGYVKVVETRYGVLMVPDRGSRCKYHQGIIGMCVCASASSSLPFYTFW